MAFRLSRQESKKTGNSPQYIYQDSKLQALPFSFGTFDSFLSGIGRNRVYSACCSASTTLKPVSTSLAKLKAYYPDMYTVEFTIVEKIFINHAALVPDKKVPIYWHSFFSYFSAKHVKRIQIFTKYQCFREILIESRRKTLNNWQFQFVNHFRK